MQCKTTFRAAVCTFVVSRVNKADKVYTISMSYYTISREGLADFLSMPFSCTSKQILHINIIAKIVLCDDRKLYVCQYSDA